MPSHNISELQVTRRIPIRTEAKDRGKPWVQTKSPAVQVVKKVRLKAIIAVVSCDEKAVEAMEMAKR